VITDKNDYSLVDYKSLLAAADQTDAHLARFIREVLPQNQFPQAIRAMKKYKPRLFERLKRCIHITQAPRRERIAIIKGVPNLVKKELWTVVHEMYRAYSCADGFTADRSVRKAVTIYIKGDKPKKKWPSGLIDLQDKLLKKMDSRRNWTFSFDSRAFTADLNQEEIDELRKSNDIDRIIEEPEAHILYGEYAPYPAFNPAAENTDWGVTKLNVSYAWAKGFKGQGVKVGVIDTGIDMNHIDLIDAYKGGYNFVAGNDNPKDDNFHGTFCCGIVGARENSIGYSGVAPLSDIYAIKCLNAKGGGSFTTIAAGVDWCVLNGMDIISMSLGGDMACSGVLADACNNAWNQGILVVAASGNDGDSCPEEGCVLSPANCSSVIAVGAIDRDEYRSGFSSFGPEMELIAPGEGITSCWLVGHDFYGDGLHIVGDSWYWANGTSGACPHAAGAAALIKSWYPAATNYEIREWLRDNAKDL
jgi:subtilisin family serine protease